MKSLELEHTKLFAPLAKQIGDAELVTLYTEEKREGLTLCYNVDDEEFHRQHALQYNSLCDLIKSELDPRRPLPSYDDQKQKFISKEHKPHFAEFKRKLEEIVYYLTRPNIEAAVKKSSLERLKRDLEVCGPGLQSNLVDEAYRLARQDTVDGWLSDIRNQIFSNLCREHCTRKKIETGLEVHVSAALGNYACIEKWSLYGGNNAENRGDTYAVPKVLGIDADVLIWFHTAFINRYNFAYIVDWFTREICLHDAVNRDYNEFCIKRAPILRELGIGEIADIVTYDLDQGRYIFLETNVYFKVVKYFLTHFNIAKISAEIVNILELLEAAVIKFVDNENTSENQAELFKDIESKLKVLQESGYREFKIMAEQIYGRLLPRVRSEVANCVGIITKTAKNRSQEVDSEMIINKCGICIGAYAESANNEIRTLVVKTIEACARSTNELVRDMAVNVIVRCAKSKSDEARRMAIKAIVLIAKSDKKQLNEVAVDAIWHCAKYLNSRTVAIEAIEELLCGDYRCVGVAEDAIARCMESSAVHLVESLMKSENMNVQKALLHAMTKCMKLNVRSIKWSIIRMIERSLKLDDERLRKNVVNVIVQFEQAETHGFQGLDCTLFSIMHCAQHENEKVRAEVAVKAIVQCVRASSWNSSAGDAVLLCAQSQNSATRQVALDAIGLCLERRFWHVHEEPVKKLVANVIEKYFVKGGDMKEDFVAPLFKIISLGDVVSVRDLLFDMIPATVLYQLIVSSEARLIESKDLAGILSVEDVINWDGSNKVLVCQLLSYVIRMQAEPESGKPAFFAESKVGEIRAAVALITTILKGESLSCLIDNNLLLKQGGLGDLTNMLLATNHIQSQVNHSGAAVRLTL